MIEKSKSARPLSIGDWACSLPWLLLVEIIYLMPYAFRPGGVAAKYVWDEHCVSHTFPVAELARDQVLSGFLPLWNQMSGAGLPLAANTLDEALLPYSIVKYLLPFPAGLNLFIAIKIMIALTGAFALGRALGASRAGSILAAVVYTFTGFIAINVNSVIATAFMFPWCVFALWLLAERPRFLSFAITAAVFGISLLGGNPQIPFQALLLGYALYAYRLYMKKEKFGFGRWVLLPGAAVSLGAVLALPQLLPFVQYLARAFSHHLPGYGSQHLDPRGIVGVANPLWDPAIVFMNLSEIGTDIYAAIADKFPPSNYADATIPFPFEHLGFAAVFFIITAALGLRRLRGEAAFFTGVAVINLGLAFGIFPFSLIALVPPFDQVSNWRFTTFPSALCASALAAIVSSRMFEDRSRKTIYLAFALTAAFGIFGGGLVVTDAGLPVDSLMIWGPALAGIIALAGLLVAIMTKRPAALAIFAFLELFAYDRALDRPVFPHPMNALEKPGPITDCAGDDPEFRMLAYGEVIHPSLGMMLNLRDLRSYEMIFPDQQVKWFSAINDWERLEAVQYYLTHYYFAPEPEALTGPEVQKSSVKWLLAEGFYPETPEPVLIALLAEGPSYVQLLPDLVMGNTARDALLLHGPARAEIDPPGEDGELLAFLGMLPKAEKDGSDGAWLQITADDRVVMSRFLYPAENSGWKQISTFAGPQSLTVLPGPHDEAVADYVLFSDLHNPVERGRFEKEWKLTSAGRTKCYHRREALPRLRVAKSVMTVADTEACLRAAAEGASAEIITADEEWPAGEGGVSEVNWGANRIDATVEMEGAGTLVLADTLYPGWKAEVDGVETAIVPANCAFRAISLDEGEHNVSFIFRPEAFRIALWAGLVSWSFFLGIIACRLKTEKGDGSGP